MENFITATVRDALKELELNYQEDDGVFEFCIKIEHTNVTVKVFCFEEEEILIAVAFSGLYAPEDRMDAVCRWICERNIRSKIGNYNVDAEDGEVSFRISCPLDGGAMNADIAKVAVLNAVKRMDDDYLDLLKLLYFNESCYNENP